LGKKFETLYNGIEFRAGVFSSLFSLDDFVSVLLNSECLMDFAGVRISATKVPGRKI
jgi:hypothetical protein